MNLSHRFCFHLPLTCNFTSRPLVWVSPACFVPLPPLKLWATVSANTPVKCLRAQSTSLPPVSSLFILRKDPCVEEKPLASQSHQLCSAFLTRLGQDGSTTQNSWYQGSYSGRRGSGNQSELCTYVECWNHAPPLLLSDLSSAFVKFSWHVGVSLPNLP